MKIEKSELKQFQATKIILKYSFKRIIFLRNVYLNYIDLIKYPKKKAQIKRPNKFIHAKILLFSNFLVNIKIPEIKNKCKNKLKGKNSNPNPNGPPLVNNISIVLGMKQKTFVPIIKSPVNLFIFIFLYLK